MDLSSITRWQYISNKSIYIHILNKNVRIKLWLLTEIGISERNVLKSDTGMVYYCGRGSWQKDKGEFKNEDSKLSSCSDVCVLSRCGRRGDVRNRGYLPRGGESIRPGLQDFWKWGRGSKALWDDESEWAVAASLPLCRWRFQALSRVLRCF